MRTLRRHIRNRTIRLSQAFKRPITILTSSLSTTNIIITTNRLRCTASNPITGNNTLNINLNIPPSLYHPRKKKTIPA